MKTRTKRWLSLACLLIITGVVIFGVAFMRSGFDFGVLDGTKYTAQSLDMSNEVFGGDNQIEGLNLEVGSFDIDIIHGDEFRIDYHTSEHSTIYYSYTDNIFSFRHQESWKKNLRGFKGINLSRLKVTVVIPQGTALNLNCPSTHVSMDSLTLSRVEIKANSANLKIKNLATTDFVFRGSSARLELDGATLDSLTIDGNSSTYRLNNIAVANDIEIKGASARTYLENVTASNATIVGNSATFVLTNVVLSGNISVTGASARTRFYNCSAQDYVGSGNSSNIIVENSEFNSVKYSGSSAKFRVTDRIVCNSFDFSGNSSNIHIRIAGTQDDFASIEMSGSSANFRIDDKKCGSSHHQSGNGHKTFTAKGNSTTCKIWFVA